MKTLGVAAVLLTLLSPTAARAQTDATPPWRVLGLDRAVDWIHDPEVFIDGRNVKRNITQQGVDRAAMLDAAIAQAKNKNRLVMWYVYRIVEDSSRGRQMYRAPVLDLYAQQVWFNDPDVAGIIDEHFVPIRMVCDEALAQRFDLRPLEFVEPAVVFLNGDGEVVHYIERVRTFHALWFARLLGRVLDAGKIDVPAARAARAGQYKRALAALRAGKHRNEFELDRARMLRRLGQYERALAALEQSSGATGVAETALIRGLILTQSGQHEAAIDVLQGATLPEFGRADEARYMLGHNYARLGLHTPAKRAFESVVELKRPDSMFTARARANLEQGPDERPYGATFSGFESFDALPEAAYRGLPRDTTWPGEPRTREQLIEHAVAFLLDQQREDGGFADSRYAYWPNPDITPNAWVAITSLAASALHTHRALDPKRIDAAVRRAEDFAFDPNNLRRGLNEDVYADTYRLTYLVTRHADADAPTRQHLVDRMSRIVGEAHQRQRESGFFAHEYPNAFCTGAMLWSIYRARALGAEVPVELISRGLNALASARRDDGAYSYSGSVGSRNSKSWGTFDAAARMPLCESVLRAFGESDPDRVRFAFENYLQHLDRHERVRRNDFHSDGEVAGFFFFHGLYHTSEVMALADEATREQVEQRMLQLLQRIGEFDGAFIDSHEIGRSYGTAMALLVLR